MTTFKPVWPTCFLIVALSATFFPQKLQSAERNNETHLATMVTRETYQSASTHRFSGIDIMNQLFFEFHTFDCPDNRREKRCNLFEAYGLAMGRLGDIFEPKHINRLLHKKIEPQIEVIRDCLAKGCLDFSEIEIPTQQKVAVTLTEALAHVSCLAGIDPENYFKTRRHLYEYYIEGDGYSILLSRSNGRSFRSNAYLFLSNNSFPQCAYLQTSQEALLLLSRLHFRNPPNTF